MTLPLRKINDKMESFEGVVNTATANKVDVYDIISRILEDRGQIQVLENTINMDIAIKYQGLRLVAMVLN